MSLYKKFLWVTVVSFICIFSSCTSEDNVELLTIKVNHFKQSGLGFYPGLFFLTQTEDEFGSNDWGLFFDGIKEFEYELGYVYTLKVEKHIIENPSADGSSFEIRLIDVKSKEQVSPNTTFEILLLRKYDNTNSDSFITGDLQSGFILLDQTKIDCEGMCNDLLEKLKLNVELTGVFKHQSAGVLKLVELKNN